MNPLSQGPLQEARKKAYREIIITTAERVFADRGFEAAKIQDIAEEIGVSGGYHLWRFWKQVRAL